MGLKKYIGFGLFFIILLGVYVYSFEGGKYTLNVVDVPISLPIAVWIILPVILLFLATIAHLMFYGTANAIKFRRVKKDGERFTQAAKEALLGKEIKADYKSEFFKLPGAILPLLNSDPYKAKKYRIYNDDIQDILEAKERLDNGEVVDLTKYALKPSNPNMLQNALNHMAEDKTYAATILKRCDDKVTCKKAFLTFASYAPISELVKYEIEPSREVFDIMINRIGAKEDALELSNSEIVSYVKHLNYSSEDFITLMKTLRAKLVPDRLLNLAEKLAHEFPHVAGEGYLYVLFELQMIDDAREFLANASEDEYQKFRYILFLKDQGRNFDTELFI